MNEPHHLASPEETEAALRLSGTIRTDLFNVISLYRQLGRGQLNPWVVMHAVNELLDLLKNEQCDADPERALVWLLRERARLDERVKLVTAMVSAPSGERPH